MRRARSSPSRRRSTRRSTRSPAGSSTRRSRSPAIRKRSLPRRCRRAKLTARDLVAVGITNQRETTVVWDRSGRPIHNALVWQDTRVDPLVAFYSGQGGKDRFRASTGLPLASYFSGLKLKWLLDNVAGRARARAGGRAAVRNDRQLGRVESHRRCARRPARHRRDECEPHAAHAPGLARLGRRAAERVLDSARAVAAYRVVERGLR